ncbi:aldehyde dehydrogenase [Lepidopterella palustris CBS 459.81]|uniref:aldehyde dehydrogenase (NAD(+)) n=1 Tax=Lepidopterella palustris CBS 459.81 TaxID=1314670 RepID=A0A8E2E6R5_9PEZI|nr:aldehyde dehydrogenase [Lepidopterella palustris CBS 459.81]
MAPPVSFTTFYNVVNGENRGSKQSYHGVNPSTGEDLWDVPVATKQDLEDAVKAARTAFKSWSKKPFDERVELLLKICHAYEPYEKQMGDLLVKENGKPKPFATGEAGMVPEMLEYFLGQRLDDEVWKLEDRECVIRYAPIGVVAGILPWNYPLAQVSQKLAPALMAGNTLIIKPSPLTPYSALKLVEIAQQVLPPGVIQVLGGDDRLGPWLTEHEDIDKIAFTGSVATGKKVMASCAKTLKRVTLELGGNDAAIVCPDVDINEVAKKLVMGAMFNSGQVCATVKRVYVHQDIYQKMIDAMVAVVKAMKYGDPEDASNYLGPTQNEMQFEKVKDMYEDVKKHGYKTPIGGGIAQRKGYFAEPSIVDNPPNDARIMVEEQFAPMLPVQPWSDEDEVIERANSSKMGLGAAIWSKDLARAQRIGGQIQAGSVFINSQEMLTFKVPFGGFKESGIGYESGPAAAKGYCNMQVFHYVK